MFFIELCRRLCHAYDMREEWRPVIGYENIYEVSNMGRIRRSAYVMCQGESDGYKRIRLFKNKSGKMFGVHQLVAEAFLGPKPSPSHEVNHKHGNTRDNRDTELEWCTRLENMQHAFKNGLAKRPPNGEQHNSKTHPDTFPRGESHGNAKLTDSDVRAIRSEYATGTISQPQLAKRYSVSLKVIWMVVNHVTWKHVN